MRSAAAVPVDPAHGHGRPRKGSGPPATWPNTHDQPASPSSRYAWVGATRPAYGGSGPRCDEPRTRTGSPGGEGHDVLHHLAEERRP